MTIKIISAAVLFLSFCPAPSWAQALIISDVVDGDIWQTTIVLTNTTAASANVSLSFYEETTAPATQPWNLSFLEVSSTSSITLAAGETLLLHTPGTAAVLSQGWGQLVADPGVVAYAIFTKRPPGLPAQVGTSPAAVSATGILVPFDNTSGNVAAVALANTGSTPETITVNIRTTAGTITQGTPVAIPAQGHMTFTLPQQFTATAGQSGLAEFYTTSGTLSILALSFNPAGSLTTAPVYSETGPPILGSSSGGGGTLPQFSFIETTENGQPASGAAAIEIFGGSGGYTSATFEGSLGSVSVSPFYLIAATFNSVSLAGQTFTLSNVYQLESSSFVRNDNTGVVVPITSGTVVITLSPLSGAAGTAGSVSGTFTFVCSFGTLTGTISGSSYMGTLLQ